MKIYFITRLPIKMLERAKQNDEDKTIHEKYARYPVFTTGNTRRPSSIVAELLWLCQHPKTYLLSA
jgi:hypothetical protein